MATKEIRDFAAVVAAAAADKLITQQDADNITRYITVTQIVGAVNPKAHAALHQNAGADEISVAGLSGVLADPQTAILHALGSAIHDADTLAAISALISDGTIVLASQAEAEAGAENTKRMTALRVAQAITALTPNPGKLLQAVHSADGAVATGTVVIPQDDSIPQNTEGDEYLSVAITPNSTSNRLLIEALVVGAHSGGGNLTLALFQDAIAGALTAVGHQLHSANGMAHFLLAFEMAAGTTSATTFKIRVGSSAAGTFTFNGISAGRIYGGVSGSYIRITELG